MKTINQRNMVNRGMKLAIGDEPQTLFHTIVNATKQAAEETRKELAPMKKTLTDIDGALAAQREHVAKPPLSIAVDNTYGFYKKDGRLWIGNKTIRLNIKEKILTADDTVYKLTPGLLELIINKYPRLGHYNSNAEGVYRSLVAQTSVKSFPNRTVGDRPHATWKWRQLLKKMVIPGEMRGEESGDTDGAESDIASVGDIGEPSGRTAPGITTSDSDMLSPGSSISSPDYGMSPSPAHTRSYGKAAKPKKDRDPFYKGFEGRGVVYLPGDINGLTKKLHLLAAEFFAGSTTFRNELVHILDALLRLQQLTRKEYTDITARLAASLRLYTRVAVLQ